MTGFMPAPERYQRAVEILAVALGQPIEVVAGIECPPGSFFIDGHHVERDADGLNPLFARRIKRISEILETHS